MKKLLAIFILNLCFITPSQADDVQDFEIAGISIGESLLNYFSKSEIKNARNYDNLPSDMKYRIIDIQVRDVKNKSKFRDFTTIQFYYIPGDQKFIVQSLNGRKKYNNINDCYNEQKEVEEALSVYFKNAKMHKQEKTKHISLNFSIT